MDAIVAARDVETPLGAMQLIAGPRGLVAASFLDERAAWSVATAGSATRGSDESAVAREMLRRAVAALAMYWKGDGRALAMMPVAPSGTPFQRAVWRALRRIPYGRTRTYGQIARAVGRPKASRAVGAANHDNPIGLFIPCHRVVGTGMKLTGYAAGLERKQWLLEHEGVLLAVASASA